eukprot:CAMPEP_0206433896 /NCGR_PEP_ID=MMETSP0324_2-20121206/8796_1 /ASSEMBLY_ACC=CAM_ASM_000836 /TAXON_ID=2866 /ORGANISM="Crypthecodinium cohnii, Strain Seligo" /LENGTH=156 /DNA_ID=CAMNT_0053900229 /DNA_START=562 /DNA_END=1029 /DNA_ORIENTATION=-
MNVEVQRRSSLLQLFQGHLKSCGELVLRMHKDPVHFDNLVPELPSKLGRVPVEEADHLEFFHRNTESATGQELLHRDPERRPRAGAVGPVGMTVLHWGRERWRGSRVGGHRSGRVEVRVASVGGQATRLVALPGKLEMASHCIQGPISWLDVFAVG